MDSDFDKVTWQNEPTAERSPTGSDEEGDSSHSGGLHVARGRTVNTLPQSDAVDLAGVSGQLECKVESPLKEGDGNNAYISYLITTHTDIKSFLKTSFSIRRRFTDFVFLYKALLHEYPACAIPPLPDKHKMEYVRGDRFGPDFTHRRAHSLHRFLKRVTLHPILRRALALVLFLESADWHSHMRNHASRASGTSETGTSVFDNFADTFVNAFSKVHKPDKRFIEVRDKSDKMDEDLGHVEKIVARVARRETDLETDYADLSVQFMKLAALEPDIEIPVHSFARGVDATAKGLCALREHTDQNYLGSLRDMEAYISAVKALLKTREQKQLDFEGLTEYLAKAAADRDILASPHHSSPMSPTNFVRAKIEDIRGVDHEAARRERLRKLELQIERLTEEVEAARRTAEMFDEQVVKEVADFEQIKSIEFRDTFGALAEKHATFYEDVIETWEDYLRDMDKE